MARTLVTCPKCGETAAKYNDGIVCAHCRHGCKPLFKMPQAEVPKGKIKSSPINFEKAPLFCNGKVKDSQINLF